MTASAAIELVKDLLGRMKADRVPMLSAAVAFWGMLAFVPGLVALVSLYGLVADPTEVERQVRQTTDALPEEAQALIVSQLRTIVGSPSSSLGAGLVIGVLIALVSASTGVRTLTEAVSAVYGDPPRSEGFVAERGKALGLTLGAVAFLALAVFVIAAAPDLAIVQLLRWPAVGAGLVLAVGVLFRVGPSRRPEKRLVSPGAVTAAVLLVVVSVAFSTYTSSFGRYNETYGSLGAVVVLLLWLQLAGLTILVGAEVNQVRRR